MAIRHSNVDDICLSVDNNIEKESMISDTVITMGNNEDSGEFDSDSPINVIQNTSFQDAEDEINNNTLIPSRENDANFNIEKRDPVVSKKDLLFLIIPILTHFYNFGNDIFVAIDYLINQEYKYSGFTIALIILSTISNIWISSRMRNTDTKNAEEDETRRVFNEKAELRAPCIMIVGFQLVRPLRYWRSLCYAWKVRKCDQEGDQEYYYPKLLKEQEDLALLNVVEGFLESAPQLILQLSILFIEDRAITVIMGFKIAGGCWGLIMLGWSMAKYHRAGRLAQPDKAVINYTGTTALFIGYLGTIASRIFFISIVAINSTLGILVSCLLICIPWTVWLLLQDGVHVFCRDKSVPPHAPLIGIERIRIFFFAVILAVVHRFTFINISDGPTRVRSTIYQIQIFMENGIIFILWFMLWNSPGENISFPLYVLVIVAVVFYFIGIGATAMYYMYLHPTVGVPFCSGLCLSNVEDGQIYK